MALRAADRRDDDRYVRDDPLARDDVRELLGTEVRPEAGLGDEVVGQRGTDAVGHERVGPVRDIGERTAVDQGGNAFDSLDEVRAERVAEERRRGPRDAEVVGCDRIAVGVFGEDDPSDLRL